MSVGTASKPDTSQDNLLQLLLVSADGIVKKFLKWNPETFNYALANCEYKNGNGQQMLVLRRKPIQCYTLQGTCVGGSPVITALAGIGSGFGLTTSVLIAGMPVTVIGTALNAQLTAVPQNTTILSVDSATQVTLTNNLAVSGTFTLVFGCRVFYNPAGWFGDGVSAFVPGTPPSNEFFLGVDYAIQRDELQGQSRSAMLQRLGGGPLGNWSGWPGQWPMGGFLSAQQGPFNPRGLGNYAIHYTAGYGVGATAPTTFGGAPGTLPASTTLPYELVTAPAAVVGFMRTTIPKGTPLDYEALGAQVLLQLQGGNPNKNPVIGTLLSQLRPYRDFVI